MKYLGRRLVQAIFLLVGVSILSFLFTALAPGSFLDEMKLNPQISPDTVSALRSQYGLDKPLPVRYGRWVKSVLQGQWGYSFAYNSPVRSLIVPRARNTVLLTATATLLVWVIAVPLGVGIASRPGRAADKVSMGATSVLLCVPELVMALGFLVIVVRTNLLPVGGMTSVDFDRMDHWSQMRDLASHLVVPVIVLVLAGLPILVRHVHTSMTEVLRSPFIQAARGHGIGNRRVLFRYALPVAANPLVSLFGLSVAGLLSGSVLVEVIFGWPGLGPLLLESILARDLYVVIGVVMSSTVFMIGGNLVADLMLVAADPRIRVE